MKWFDGKYFKAFILAMAVLLTVKILFDFESLSGIFSYITGIIKPFVFGFILAYCINIPVDWIERKLKGGTVTVKVKSPTKYSRFTKYKDKAAKEAAKEAARSAAAEPDKYETITHKGISVKWIRKGARPISIVATLVLLIGFIVFGLINLIPMLVNNFKQLHDEMPGYIDAGINTIENLPFAEQLGLQERLNDLSPEDFLGFLPEFGEITTLATNFFSGVFTFFLTIVATIYFLAEYNRTKDFIKRLIRAHSPNKQRVALKYIRLADSSFRKFLTCQFLDSLILGSITMVMFSAIGSHYAVTLGLLLGVLNIIPYFGSIFGSMFAVFIIWASDGIQKAILVAILLLVIQQFDGNFINPKIMGKSFKISPVLVIIAITIGGAVGGVMGMIFAIPIANVIKTILEEYIHSKEEKQKQGELRRRSSDIENAAAQSLPPPNQNEQATSEPLTVKT